MISNRALRSDLHWGVMKICMFIIVLSISSISFGFECGDVNKYAADYEDNYNQATRVFFGQVVSGKKLSDDALAFIINVDLEVKGSGGKVVALETGTSVHYPMVILGGRYLVFVYNDHIIDPCEPFIEVFFKVGSKADLDRYGLRDDLSVSSLFKYISKVIDH